MNGRKTGFAVPAALAAIGLGLCGCVGYRLGSTLPPGIHSVFVTTFVNESTEPRIETVATQAAVQEFQRDGTLRVTARERADSMLDVTLTEFSLDPVGFDSDNPQTAREYRMRIAAQIVYTRLRPNREVMLTRTVAGDATFDLAGDLFSAKQRVLPDAARDLARKIVESVVEYW